MSWTRSVASPRPKALKPLLAALVLGILGGQAAHADWPAWMDRLLFNAEERTRRGAASLESRNFDQAAASMDTAMRLAPEDATAKFNAGTARLPLAPEQGRSLLEAAGSQTEDRALKSLAHYNAGNSLLEAGELQSAIDSYKQALRNDPNYDDAKFNLELAQKRLKEQQQEQQNQDQQNQDQEQENQDQQEQNQDQQDQQDQGQQDPNQENQDQEQQDQENQEQQGQDQQDQEQDQENQDQENQDQEQQEQNQSEDPQNQEQEQNQDQQGQGGQNQPQEESPLPEFQDLPDMTAEEAAAILEAIENMEREQRRQEALEAAKAGVRGKKDW